MIGAFGVPISDNPVPLEERLIQLKEASSKEWIKFKLEFEGTALKFEFESREEERIERSEWSKKGLSFNQLFGLFSGLCAGLTFLLRFRHSYHLH